MFNSQHHHLLAVTLHESTTSLSVNSLTYKMVIVVIQKICVRPVLLFLL